MKIVRDSDAEKFTRSKCQCEFCYETHRMGLEFDHYEPTNHLQWRMKDVIARLEAKYRGHTRESRNNGSV